MSTRFFDCRFCGGTAGVDERTQRAFHARPACPEFERFAEGMAPGAEAKTFVFPCRFCGGEVSEQEHSFDRFHDDTPCEMFEHHRDNWNVLVANR